MPDLSRSLSALLLFALCSVSLLVHAEKWENLSAQQKEALAPLSDTWNTVPVTQQTNFLAIAKRYPLLSPQKQQRLHQQLTKWVKLTPEQRKRAREKYRAFKKVPPDQRAAVRKMVLEQQAASAVAPVTPAAPETP